jgi:uncharacterized protein YodC (DUF2158 family)
MNFKVGDTVTLRSGSPMMTIDSLDVEHQGGTTQGAWCSWFDDKQKPQKRWYPLTSLDKAEFQTA